MRIFGRGRDHTMIVSSVRVEETPLHAWIDIWNRGGKAGTLCVNKADWQHIVCRLLVCETEELEELETK